MVNLEKGNENLFLIDEKYQIRADVVREFRKKVYQHSREIISGRYDKNNLFRNKTKLFSKKNFANLKSLFIELNNYKKFHLIEKKILTKIEKDFQPPFINPKFNYNKKSVLLVTGSLQAGGAERQIVNLAKTLSSSGFVVSIYLFPGKYPTTTLIINYYAIIILIS